MCGLKTQFKGKNRVDFWPGLVLDICGWHLTQNCHIKISAEDE